AKSPQVSPSLGQEALGHGYAVAGQKANAEQILKTLVGQERPPAKAIAAVYLGLGNKNAALDWLERSATDHTLEYSLKVNPTWKDLKSEPRFIELLRKIHLGP